MISQNLSMVEVTVAEATILQRMSFTFSILKS